MKKYAAVMFWLTFTILIQDANKAAITRTTNTPMIPGATLTLKSDAVQGYAVYHEPTTGWQDKTAYYIVVSGEYQLVSWDQDEAALANYILTGEKK